MSSITVIVISRLVGRGLIGTVDRGLEAGPTCVIASGVVLGSLSTEVGSTVVANVGGFWIRVRRVIRSYPQCLGRI